MSHEPTDTIQVISEAETNGWWLRLCWLRLSVSYEFARCGSVFLFEKNLLLAVHVRDTKSEIGYFASQLGLFLYLLPAEHVWLYTVHHSQRHV